MKLDDTITPGYGKWKSGGHGGPDDRWLYPSLEDFHPLTFYALTISPNHFVTGDSDTGMTEHVTGVFTDILPLFTKADYVLRPEISTKSTLLHYHGTIMWSDRMAITQFYWYTMRALKTICTFTIKPIDSNEKWHDYCVKQRLHMKPFMQSLNLRYRLTNGLKSPFVKTKRSLKDVLSPELGKQEKDTIISRLIIKN